MTPEASDDDTATVQIEPEQLLAIQSQPVHTLDVLSLPETSPGLPTFAATPAVRFEDLGRLASGGMGEVHVARDVMLRRHVAQKRLHEAYATRPRAVGRFVAEAQVTAQLDHPNIVPVYSLEEDAGTYAYTMKLVQGDTLKDRLLASGRARRNAEPPPAHLRLPALLEAFLKVCDAMAFAHHKGVAHRDLKPENIMLGEAGEVYVMDWGLARTRDADALELDDAQPTVAGKVMGTPLYMAPEQARGDVDKMGPATDQYALGLILFEMVSGVRARQAEGLANLLLAASKGELVPLVASGPHESLHPAWHEVLNRATALEPADRFPDVRALATAVRLVATSPSPPPAGRVQRWLVRNLDLAAYVLIVLATTSALLLAGAVVAGTLGAQLLNNAAQAREARLATFLAQVSAQASAIDQTFASVETQVDRIGGASTALLQHGAPSERPLLGPADFTLDSPSRPPDTAFSPAYQRELSTVEPDVLVASGAHVDTAQSQLRRLAPVADAMRQAHLATRLRAGSRSPEQADEDWRAEAGPVRFAMVGTTDGAFVELPGAEWDATGFDPRERPWYQAGTGALTPTWGLPYQEASSGILLIPCSVEIPGPAGEHAGVATLTMSFDYLIDRHLVLDHPAVVETYLLDADGHVRVRSSEIGRKGRVTGLAEAWNTPLYPNPAVVEALGTAGVHATRDGATLVYHHPLAASGWSYVVEVDAERAGG